MKKEKINNRQPPASGFGVRRKISAARVAALVGIMAATLECGKLALAALPNVEVVTLLAALFGYTFGGIGVLASVVFVCIEPVIWGIGPWFVSYIIYWPTLTAIFWLLGRRCPSRVVVPTLTALVMTFLFGVLTSLVEVGLFSGSYERFFYRFGIYYARGLWFYLTQLVTNAVVFPLLFKPASNFLFKLGTGWRNL